MFRVFQRSLLLRLGAAMATITVLALLSMVSAMVIAELLKGQAAAINQAGTLRMQSYAITTQLFAQGRYQGLGYDAAVRREMTQFAERLDSPRLTDALTLDRHGELGVAYRQIVHGWRGEIRPMLLAYLRERAAAGRTPAGVARLAADRDRIRTRMDGYVAQVNDFVARLEQAAEAKITLLRMIQGASLFLTLIVVYITMYLMHTNVLIPLRDLLGCAEQARRGDFTARVQHVYDDELGRLGKAYNVMAEDLSKIYGNLESLVAEKTADLERSNRYLKLLYNTITRLNETPVSEATYSLLLKELERTVGVGPGAICVAEAGGARALNLATTAREDRGRPSFCALSDCADCLGAGEPRVRLIPDARRTRRVYSVPLKDREQSHGALLLEIPPDTELAPWQQQLIEAMGRHIGMAIGNLQRTAQGRRLALLEERAVIARELHDSLAQALSYQKIQVSRLQSLLDRQEPRPDIAAVVQELRDGLNGAYRQLRELLTTFRLQVDGRGLGPALADTIHEFSSRSAIPITLDDRLAGCRLSVNEEIHILQIVREALSNVVRHAHAGRAEVRLYCDREGHASVIVDDDGIGIDAAPAHVHHYGLAIMEERARGLHGELLVTRRADRGTRVTLQFTPAAYRVRPAAAANAGAP